MRDSDCVAFLQWALPRMRMRWPGFRRVRRQVCRRIQRRLNELDLADLDAYRVRLGTDAAEWARLDSLCRITISRFYRDRALWDHLGDVLLADLSALARRRGDAELRCWSIGCASGEEPYTLAMIWRRRIAARSPGLTLSILAGDADPCLLDRARRGVYAPSSLRDLPGELRGCFEAASGGWRIDPIHREAITFVRQDVRDEPPRGDFHLVLCRNLVFTYYDEPLQRELLARWLPRIVRGGALIVGIHESLPARAAALSVRNAQLGIHVRERES